MTGDRLLRTFLAVKLPGRVVDLQRMLKSTLTLKKGNLRWVKPGQIHLTLKFLGHTPRETIPDIIAALRSVLESTQAFESRLAGTGCFPKPERPRVLWLGVTENRDRIQALAQSVDRALEPLGFPPEEEEYQPHVTLARIKYPPKWTPDIGEFLRTDYEPLPFQLYRVELMSSELFPDGPVYSSLHTFTLQP
ncbi:MAG: RNA 2',3'-cyclic phosphodiesterase [Candidatus Neomarinimicrobiota bacterium]|nr:MAG: RNA 2',3'-cyclic phosphodiesterase [Candidatus Neomarinimicrobiota bacterium]